MSNQKKHGVSLYKAQYASFDQNRIIAEDFSHNTEEKRYYCFGFNKEKPGSEKLGSKIWGQVFHCANILFITINDKCYAKFRVEEAVIDLNPHRPGRTQLRHPFPHSDRFAI